MICGLLCNTKDCIESLDLDTINSSVSTHFMASAFWHQTISMIFDLLKLTFHLLTSDVITSYSCSVYVTYTPNLNCLRYLVLIYKHWRHMQMQINGLWLQPWSLRFSMFILAALHASTSMTSPWSSFSMSISCLNAINDLWPFISNLVHKSYLK